MEVVTACPSGTESSPFHNHDVREWSRVDNLTGVLERARRETDHWISNTNNSSQKYGKVVDCRARSCADGNLQQEARRQFEVFQSQIPGSRLQVIKTNTVSSSRWTTKSSPGSDDLNSQSFDELHFNTNLLDVSAQKSKASTGRGRRPLSRQLNLLNNSTTRTKYDNTSSTNLRRVSRLCNQIHESAVKQYLARPTVHEQQSINNSIEISDVETNTRKNEHSRLTRTKSTSSEDITRDSNLSTGEEKSNKGIKDLEDLEALRGWRRTSKFRRSLQLAKENRISTKPPDLPESIGSVRRIREDLEKGRRLNTALRGNNVNLEALDQILQSISNPPFGEKKIEEIDSFSSDKEDEEVPTKSSNSNKKNSFVTVESIKEARDRLRRTSSPTTNIYKYITEDSDDGIVIEDPKMSIQDSVSAKVRSYVYGMDNSMSKMPINGTGSLESRSKHLNGNFIIRNEDWYNRRKSYGFEKMQQDDVISNVKNTESSTDSGICRSSETVAPSNAMKETEGNIEYNIKANSVYNNNLNIDNWIHSDINNLDTATVTTPTLSKVFSINTSKTPFRINKDINNSLGTYQESEDIKRHSIAVDEAEYVTKTTEPKLRKTSLAINTNDLYLENEDNQFFLNRKPKKVEFCKTEVHFTAESGKVNIVETDEKPPPTNNFRRRRRNSGLIEDGIKNNNLPAFKFGDDILNNENHITENEEFQTYPGVVTVTSNTNSAFYDIEEVLKENIESDLPKGILKNKPIKPKPYLLGGTESFLSKDCINDQNTITKPWEIKLKPIRDETPMWRSAVTVKSTSYGTNLNKNTGILSENYNTRNQEIPEFQKLLMNLKPITKQHQDIDDVCNSFNGIRIVSPNNDSRRSSWSVSDRVKHVEDLQVAEGKGYSTKINFGNGETTVIENNHSKNITRHPTWPRREETSNDDRKHILKKGLVVRIGRDDSHLKHTVSSKTTNNHTSPSTTTTTKITIDFAPSHTNGKSHGELNVQSIKLPKTSLPRFKSTSLILNTIKMEQSTSTSTEKKPNDLDSHNQQIHNQLEALKKLYEDVYSDSETDTEVQTFMSKSFNLDNNIDEECSSVVSGSWSRVSAVKNILHYNKVIAKSRNHMKTDLHAQLEKDLDRMQNKANTELKHLFKEQLPSNERIESTHNRISDESDTSLIRKRLQSKVMRENDNVKLQIKKLSSPALVGQSSLNKQILCDTKLENDTAGSGRTFSERNIIKKGSLEKQKNKKLGTTSPQGIRHKSPHKDVLRQPKKSEMAYFGVPPSPKSIKTDNKETKLSNRPDLLQFSKNKKVVTENNTAEHIYENVDNLKKQNLTLLRKKREFDNNILEELTKAADQILQAVNEYANEDSRNKFHNDEGEKHKRHQNPLETISETRSWKQDKSNRTRILQNKNNGKTRIKQTPSNSSIESVNKDLRKPVTMQKSTSSVDHKVKRKTINSDNAAIKANTKARRLQRASSREALLQSHGSSSEDLPAVIEVPLRKHRLVKKTKPSQTESNSLETKIKSINVNKKREDKSENRIITSCLPEIRHKTAVSTIRSTAEKATTREKIDKVKTESKKKVLHRQNSQGTSGIPADRNKNSSSKDSRRTPTSSYKRCSRYEALLK